MLTNCHLSEVIPWVKNGGQENWIILKYKSSSQENLIKLEFSSFAGNALSASANMFHIPCVETIMDLLHFAFYRKIIVKGFLFNVHHE